MKPSKIVLAVAMTINSSALFAATPQTEAHNMFAMNSLPDRHDFSTRTSQPASKDATGEELLARGLARLATAKQPQDFRAAYHFLEAAANKGVAEAQFQLALMALDNEYVNRGEDVAIKWLEAAVAQGHKQAATALDYVRYDGGYIGC